ncbi:MAG: hypothetical protein ACI81T_001042 [Bacteroidia bacterium]|jgi:uncharacterized protein (TIGR02646 family)
MQYIEGIFKKHPKKKVAFEKAGKEFNEKHLDKLNKANLEAQNKKSEMSFENKWTELKPAFNEIKHENDTHCRCHICEKELLDVYADDIEHYRPKGTKKTVDSSKIKYWWLAYDFNNYFRCCAECNRGYKGEKFPIDESATKLVYQDGQELDDEKPLLINPMSDNHAKYFKLVFVLRPGTISDKVAILQPKDGLEGYELDKAKKTIEVFNLDLRYENYLADTQGKSHKDFIKLSIDFSRVKLFCKLHAELEELAINRFSFASPSEFANHWKTLSKKKNPVTSLGLAQLIALGQFEDLTIQLNR